jgi:putative endonuclease
MVTRDGIVAVYMMASGKHGTLYIGVTSDLSRRVWEHRESLIDGFTKTYGCTRLVWWETHDLITEAIAREKRLKAWRRDWKIELIEADNPHWDDLYGRW